MIVTPVTPTIGAVIEGIDLAAPVPKAQQVALCDALRKHLVLFLRGQHLSDEQHVAAAAIFGRPNVYAVTRARGLDDPIEFIEDTPDSPPKTDLWHTDAAFLAEPPDVAMSNLLIAPPSGGDTMWCNLYAAYDALSPAFQAMIGGLEQDLHPGEVFKRTVELQFGPGIYDKVEAEFRGARHPLVRVHPETGRPALFLCGAFVRGIAGMALNESAALYDFLRTRLHDPNLQCRWQWQAHDVAIWDERCTNHRGLSDHHPSRRLLRRCTVGGSRPRGLVTVEEPNR